MSGRHVLVIPSWYPESDSDFNGIFFREQAVSLKNAGWTVGVLALCFRSPRSLKNILGKYGLNTPDENGVRVYRYCGINWGGLSAKLNAWRWRRLGTKIFRRYISIHGMPDIIHVQSALYAGVLAKSIYRQYNVPYVLTEHSSAIGTGNISPRKEQIFVDVCRYAGSCTAVSTWLSSRLADRTNLSWSITPNSVSDIFFNQNRVDCAEGEFKFISVCFFSRNKNVDFIIKAFSEVLKVKAVARLVLVGDGALRAEYEALVDALGIRDKVDFLGLLDRAATAREMAAANVLLVASGYETFGLVVAESLGVGIPVISTKCGGPEDIINKSNGSLVEIGDFQGYVSAMKAAYADKALVDSEKISLDCAAVYSEAAVAGTYSKTYLKVLHANEK